MSKLKGYIIFIFSLGIWDFVTFFNTGKYYVSQLNNIEWQIHTIGFLLCFIFAMWYLYDQGFFKSE